MAVGKDDTAAAQAERALLASIILGESIILEKCRAASLTQADFVKRDLGFVYAAMNQLDSQGLAVDARSLTTHLTKSGHLERAGGLANVLALGDVVPTAANAETYLTQVVDAAATRSLKVDVERAHRRLDGGMPPKEVSADLRKTLERFDGRQRKNRREALVDVLIRTNTELDMIAEGETPFALECGLAYFDRTGTFARGEMILIGAQTSTGKTALALEIARRIAGRRKHVFFMSTELKATRLAVRLIARETRRNMAEIRKGLWVGERYKASSRLGEFPFTIEHAPGATLEEVRTSVKELHAEQPVDLLVLDYIQLMQGPEQNREEKVANIVQGLANLVRELDICMIVCAQLNRDFAKRSDKRPVVSDLRESGALETAPDTIIMPHRPGRWDKSVEPDILEVYVHKGRDSGEGQFDLRFDRATQYIMDLE